MEALATQRFLGNLQQEKTFIPAALPQKRFAIGNIYDYGLGSSHLVEETVPGMYENI